MHDVSSVPTSPDELVRRYDTTIRKFIWRVSRPTTIDAMETLVQDVYVRLLEQDVISVATRGIEKNGGAFTSYLFNHVKAACINAWRQERRSPLSPHRRVRPEPDEDVDQLFDLQVQRVDGRHLRDVEHAIEAANDYERFKQHLLVIEQSARLKPTSTLRTGRRMRRSLHTVFVLWRMLGNGPSPAGRMERDLAVQIARMMRLNPQTVHHMVMELRKEAVKFFGR